MKSNILYSIILSLSIIVLPITADAQKFSGGGGMSRPSSGGYSRPSTQPSKPAAQTRPATQQKPAAQTRPATQQKAAAQTRPSNQPSKVTATQQPSSYDRQPNKSINGGAQKAPDRNLSTTKPSTASTPANRDVNKTNIKQNNYSRNDVNVNRGNNNVNINVDNSRTVNVHGGYHGYVRPPVRPYPRPPYVYGGYRYYAYHPYYYHPYTPYYWGPVWHPWGFFVATMATTAIIVSVANQQYYYDQGVYYVSSNGGYTVVQAPVGATVKVLPEGTQTIVVNETTNNYYYGGTYYEETGDGYTVVPPTAGTVVEELPEGGEEVKIGDYTYVKIGDVYYQPVEVDGENKYEVVDVKEED